MVPTAGEPKDGYIVAWIMMGLIVGFFVILFVGSILIEIFRNRRKNKKSLISK